MDNIEATTTELKGKGVVFNLEPIQLEGGIKVAFFKYPEGVQIELVEPLLIKDIKIKIRALRTSQPPV